MRWLLDLRLVIPPMPASCFEPEEAIARRWRHRLEDGERLLWVGRTASRGNIVWRIALRGYTAPRAYAVTDRRVLAIILFFLPRFRSVDLGPETEIFQDEHLFQITVWVPAPPKGWLRSVATMGARYASKIELRFLPQPHDVLALLHGVRVSGGAAPR